MAGKDIYDFGLGVKPSTVRVRPGKAGENNASVGGRPTSRGNGKLGSPASRRKPPAVPRPSPNSTRSKSTASTAKRVAPAGFGEELALAGMSLKKGASGAGGTLSMCALALMWLSSACGVQLEVELGNHL